MQSVTAGFNIASPFSLFIQAAHTNDDLNILAVLNITARQLKYQR